MLKVLKVTQKRPGFRPSQLVECCLPFGHRQRDDEKSSRANLWQNNNVILTKPAGPKKGGDFFHIKNSETSLSSANIRSFSFPLKKI